MKMIEAYARILTDKGADAVGVLVSLETYVLARRSWVKIASARTTAKGIWRAQVKKVRPGAFYAPILRLVEAGKSAPRVLAQNGRISYNASKLILNVDFGVVERLADTAYPLTFSNALFKGIKQTVAGQPKRKKFSGAILMRTAVATPLVAVVSPVTAAKDTIIKDIGRNVIVDTFNIEIMKFKVREVKLQTQVSNKNLQLKTKTLELKTAKNNVTALEKKLSKAKAVEVKLKAENQSYVKEAAKKVPIQNIAANIGAEVDAANRKLGSENRPYRFGRIELDLRGTVSTDGQSMSLVNLVDLGKIGGTGSVPGVKMELLPKRPQSEISADVKVPDVTGLTETAVRRLLQEVGLRLEVISKSITSKSKIPTGQSIQQSPVAGADLPRSNSVLVVFAKTVSTAKDIS